MNMLRNLGPKSWEMLETAGISDVAALRTIGAAKSYLMVLDTGAPPSLNLLYAIAGGLEDRDWRALSATEKGRLNRELDDLREFMQSTKFSD